MKTTHEKLILLDRFYSGEMTEKEKTEFLKTVDSDVFLQEEYQDTEEIFQNIGSEKTLLLRHQIEVLYAKEANKQLSRQFSIKAVQSRIAIAAVVIIAVAISIIFALKQKSISSFNDEIVEYNITKKSPFIDTPLNPRLELLIESNFRNEVIITDMPEEDNIVTPSTDLQFGWTKLYPGIIYFNIYDTNDSLLFTNSAMGNSFKLKAPELPGIYYWVIETEEEIIKIGRFYVKEEN